MSFPALLAKLRDTSGAAPHRSPLPCPPASTEWLQIRLWHGQTDGAAARTPRILPDIPARCRALERRFLSGLHPMLPALSRNLLLLFLKGFHPEPGNPRKVNWRYPTSGARAYLPTYRQRILGSLSPRCTPQY